MWDASWDTSTDGRRPVATLVSVVSEDERHTSRRTDEATVLVTILAEDGVTIRTYPAPAADDDVRRPPFFRVPRGAAVHVRQHIADGWVSTEPPKAVIVDAAKMGSAQRDLLLKLHDIQHEALTSPNRAWRIAARREHGPSGRDLRTRRGVRWLPEAIYDRPLSRSESAALSRALRGLERRGLVLRDAPAGSGRRTSAVQVTGAGRIVAKQLRGDSDST